MKTHIAMSSQPLSLGEKTRVLCGQDLRHAEPVMVVEAESTAKIFTARDCRKCTYELQQFQPMGYRYLYFLVEGQEAKNAQAESAA